MSHAMQLKEEGNSLFRTGDYVGADSLYSKAIIADPKNSALYTNRAMARLKLGYWDSVIADCNACLELSNDNMKANFYLAQAQLAIRDFDAAVASVLKAHGLCAATNDKSLTSVTAMVHKCKKERWEHMEKVRIREGQDLEREMLELLTKERDETLMAVDDDIERRTISEECDAKIENLQAIFDKARVNAEQRRKVPDWCIDDISFGFMIDPVVTKSGKSYERASIVEHINRHHCDPVTREPMSVRDLLPNRALKEACADFLEDNGWAIDW